MPHPFHRRALLSVGLLAFAISLAPSLSQAAKKPKRVLVVTLTKGFRHDSIPVSLDVLKKLAQENNFSLEFADTDEELQKEITPDALKSLDLVIFDNTTGELPISDANKAAFIQWLSAGHGFVGMHAATDTFYQWADYGKLIGGHFNGHPWHQKVTIRVEDPKFPGTGGFVKDPVITDEIYQFKEYSRDDKRVVLSIDNASIDVTKGARDDKDYASTWAKKEGKGRVFYTSLGHRQEVWQDPRYQDLILGGMKWALGLVKADIKPGAAPKATAMKSDAVAHQIAALLP